MTSDKLQSTTAIVSVEHGVFVKLKRVTTFCTTFASVGFSADQCKNTAVPAYWTSEERANVQIV